MIKSEAHDAVGKDLQSMLVQLIGLSLDAKQAHWNVRGPHFRAVHQHLDEIVDEYHAWGDEVAERLVALGVAADGRAQTVAAGIAKDFPADTISDRKVVELFTARIDGVVDQFRGCIDRLESLDPVSQDLAIEIVAGLEKQRWMISAQLG